MTPKREASRRFTLVKEGDDMKIGVIGSGRVGFSMGKYLCDHGECVVGYYDRHPERANEAAQFTSTDNFETIEDLVAASDTLFITTTDGEIANVWDRIRQMSIENKIICHFSGSLSSDQFQGIGDTKAHGVSVHPMLAFSDKYTSYQQLKKAFFTVEGDATGVSVLSELLRKMGNFVQCITRENKALYHAAAATLSNQVVAVLSYGYEMLKDCGFDEKEAREASQTLIRGNIENVINQGCVQALTGPVERGDVETVKKHLQVIDPAMREIYGMLAQRQLQLARQKNPQKDYAALEQLLKESRGEGEPI